MKITITLKDPDGVSNAIQEAAVLAESGMGVADDDTRIAVRVSELEDACRKWIEYGEYVTIVIDTRANTATVQEAR